MGLGQKFWTWINSLDFVVWIRGYIKRYQSRLQAVGDQWLQQTTRLVGAGQIGQALLVTLASVFYVVLGNAALAPQKLVPASDEALAEIENFKANPSEYIASKLTSIGGAAETREITQALGALVMDPVISLFESYAARPEQDPHEFARSFHGYMMSLSWGGGMLNAILRPILGDRTPDFPAMLNQMYWTMGLGFLGWQTLAPQ